MPLEHATIEDVQGVVFGLVANHTGYELDLRRHYRAVLAGRVWEW